jgi:hypothetical protein
MAAYLEMRSMDFWPKDVEKERSKRLQKITSSERRAL